MTSRTPLFINSSGDPQQMQAGDTIPVIFGGVGQKARGNVGQMSGTSQIPFDNSAPLITEGTQLWSTTITPQLDDSNFAIEFAGIIDTSKINVAVTIAVFRNNTIIGYTVAGSTGYNGAMPCPFSIKINDPSTGLTPVTYSCRIGISANNSTWYFGRGAGETSGGVNNSGWSITEEL